MSDPVQRPSHYLLHLPSGQIESWDVLDALHGKNPNLWNAGKYLFRVGNGGKNNDTEDLKKARQYLNREIAHRDEYREKSHLPPLPTADYFPKD